ncbi:MAG: sugar transferase [Winogradskyella sp.]|nr:sugar transferase [Winogradskyella sp.]NNK39706.1 sugar transferase [Winogradskyella sp.]
MTQSQLRLKRLFDIVVSLIVIPIIFIPLVLLLLMATIDTRLPGLFSQKRIGQKGKPFRIYKIRTLRKENHQLGKLDNSATTIGKFLRRTKLDELPQFFNVLIGDMSLVGPRPDIEGFADQLKGDDRIILIVKPGITGPATLKYKNEERILSRQLDPENYNRTKIWPDKVRINENYVRNYSFYLDLVLIFKSILNP